MIPLPTVLIWLILSGAITGVLSFIGGCEYKDRDIQKAKLEGVKNAARLAKQDGTAGNNAAATLRKTEADIERQKISLSKQASKSTLATVKFVQGKCEVEGTNPQAAANSEKDNVNETPPVIVLTADFKRLYDLSYSPEGNVGVRAGTYEATKPTTLDEGFTNYILPNNLDCAMDRSRLEALQKRILEKQKIYSSLFKD